MNFNPFRKAFYEKHFGGSGGSGGNYEDAKVTGWVIGQPFPDAPEDYMDIGSADNVKVTDEAPTIDEIKNGLWAVAGNGKFAKVVLGEESIIAPMEGMVRVDLGAGFAALSVTQELAVTIGVPSGGLWLNLPKESNIPVGAIMFVWGG